MVEYLRKQDRDYFGPRVGRGSAIHTILCVVFGIMPLSFARGGRISAEDVIKRWENDKLVWERGQE